MLTDKTGTTVSGSSSYHYIGGKREELASLSLIIKECFAVGGNGAS